MEVPDGTFAGQRVDEAGVVVVRSWENIRLFLKEAMGEAEGVDKAAVGVGMLQVERGD